MEGHWRASRGSPPTPHYPPSSNALPQSNSMLSSVPAVRRGRSRSLSYPEPLPAPPVHSSSDSSPSCSQLSIAFLLNPMVEVPRYGQAADPPSQSSHKPHAACKADGKEREEAIARGRVSIASLVHHPPPTQQHALRSVSTRPHGTTTSANSGHRERHLSPPAPCSSLPSPPELSALSKAVSSPRSSIVSSSISPQDPQPAHRPQQQQQNLRHKSQQGEAQQLHRATGNPVDRGQPPTLLQPLLEMQRREEQLLQQREKYLILETQRLELRRQLTQLQLRLGGGADTSATAPRPETAHPNRHNQKRRPAPSPAPVDERNTGDLPNNSSKRRKTSVAEPIDVDLEHNQAGKWRK